MRTGKQSLDATCSSKVQQPPRRRVAITAPQSPGPGLPRSDDILLRLCEERWAFDNKFQRSVESARVVRHLSGACRTSPGGEHDLDHGELTWVTLW